jgi:hypothetical protein
MSNTPKHCEIAIEYYTLAKKMGGDDYTEVNKLFYVVCDGNRSDLSGPNNPQFSPNRYYFRKPETHIVNGHEVPAPYREAPSNGSQYSYICSNGSIYGTWDGVDTDRRRLASNNCFKSGSDAEQNALAMFKIGKYAEVNL